MSRFPRWYTPGIEGKAAAIGAHAALSLPTGWDAATLGGQVLNGKSLVIGGELLLKIDPKPKKGANPAKPTTHGLDVSEFGLRTVCWTQEQIDDVDDAIAELCPPANIEPVTFDHPQLRSIIRQLGQLHVLVRNTPLWVPSSVITHGWEVHFKLLHWPAAQRDKGESNTALRPATFTDPNLRAASDRNPLPTTDSANFAPPDSARGGF